MADAEAEAPAVLAAAEAPPVLERLPLQLAAQEEQAPNFAADEAVRLFEYFTTEFKGFLTHVSRAVEDFRETGKVPAKPLYAKEPALRGEQKRKQKKERKPRAPTAFNHFVAARIKQMKSDGLVIEDDRNNNEVFKRAVAEWGQMTPEQKQKYKEEHLGLEHAAVDAEEADEAEHAQLLLDGADKAGDEAHPAGGVGPKRKQVGGPVLSSGGHQADHDQISLTDLVTGGEAAEPDAGSPAALPGTADAEEPGRKKRKGTSVKSKP